MCHRAMAGCCRSRSNASVVRASSRGLRLSSSARHTTGGSRSSCGPPMRYPHAARTVADSLDGIVHGVLAEDAPRQRQLVDVAEQLKVGESGQQVSVPGDVGADRAVNPAGPGPLEFPAPVPISRTQSWSRPAPVRGAVLAAAQQYQSDGVSDRPLVVAGIRAPHHRPGIVERPQQSGDDAPLRSVAVIASAASHIHSEPRKRFPLRRTEVGPPVVEGRIDRPRPDGRRGRPDGSRSGRAVTVWSLPPTARRGARASAHASCGSAPCRG